MKLILTICHLLVIVCVRPGRGITFLLLYLRFLPFFTIKGFFGGLGEQRVLYAVQIVKWLIVTMGYINKIDICLCNFNVVAGKG